MKALACHINKSDPSHTRLKQQYKKKSTNNFLQPVQKQRKEEKNKKGKLLRYTLVGEDLRVEPTTCIKVN